MAGEQKHLAMQLTVLGKLLTFRGVNGSDRSSPDDWFDVAAILLDQGQPVGGEPLHAASAPSSPSPKEPSSADRRPGAAPIENPGLDLDPTAAMDLSKCLSSELNGRRRGGTNYDETPGS
ncbi:hypothetical protein NL676_027881 [Syzygium grande]|nr:hypothetical protein NL676_027881 [Syzygium grande]